MAYIPFTPIVPEKDASLGINIPLAENGNVLSHGKDAQGAILLNLDLSSDVIKTRRRLVKMTDGLFGDGTFYSITKEPFYEKIVLHVGTSLYTFSENGEVEKLELELPDKKSFFVYFMSCLYIYCDYRIFKLDENFEITECEPFVPTLFEDLSSSAMYAKKLDVPHNRLCPIIRVKYKETSALKYKLPLKADVTRTVKVYNYENEMNESNLTITEDNIALSNVGVGNTFFLEVVYYLKEHSDIEFDDTIYRCTAVDTFGGAVGGGTRIFFTGDSKKKGYYYKSELQNPLYVPSDEYEIIGDGCENVTSLIKMYGHLVILTEKSVYQMGYSLGENGAVFAVKQLTNAVGCDMPLSVQLVDNRVVFANSKSGIYIIDSIDDNGEHNIKPLSYNILKGNSLGFLDNDKDALKDATSCDIDRKYYLFVGEKAYIWDYDESPYSESGSYSKAQKRLDFYIYSGVKCGFAHKIGDGFVIFSKEELAFYGFDETSDDVEFMYKCESQSFGSADMKKYVKRLSLVLLSNEHTDVTLNVSGDGKTYYSRVISVCDKKKCININLPKKAMFDFSYSLSGVGDVEIHSAGVEYMYLKK